MAVEHKHELKSVTVANQLVTAEYEDTFLVDGEVKASAVEQDTFDLRPPVFVEENGKLRVGGSFPSGSNLTLEIDGQKIQFGLTETVEDFQLGGFIPLMGGLMYLPDSVADADGIHFHTVYEFQRVGDDPDVAPVDVAVSNVSVSAPAVALPDDVAAMLRGVLG